MSKIADCAAEIVQLSRDHADGQKARQRIDKFFDNLAVFARQHNQNCSREISDLNDRVTAAAEVAARRGDSSLSDRLEKIVDYLASKPKALRPPNA